MCYQFPSFMPGVQSLIGSTEEDAWSCIGCNNTLHCSLYCGNAQPVTPIVSTLKEPLIPTKIEMIWIGGIGQQSGCSHIRECSTRDRIPVCAQVTRLEPSRVKVVCIKLS